MNSIFQIINSVQTRCSILEKHWIVTAPEVRLENLKVCAHSIEALVKMCEAETILLKLSSGDQHKVDFNGQQPQAASNSQQAHVDDLRQMKDKLLQCVRMLAQAGRTNVTHMSSLLDISEDKARELMALWKS